MADSRPWRARLRSWGRDLGVVALIVVAVHFYQTWHTASGEAPALRAHTLAGQAVDLSELRRRGPVMVHFWATWCGVCSAMEGNVESAAEHGTVLAVATRSGSDAEVARVLRERHMGHDNIVYVNDPSGALAAAWGVSAYPTSFFVDPAGQLVATEVGYVTTVGLLARLWWAR